jgi:threonine/homoserine/homoserine lactone efflux protein
VAGFIVGDLTWFAIAATGLAALARTAATVFVVIKWAGVAYLLYLAWKLWTAPAERVAVQEDRRQHGWRAFVASLMLTLANPKGHPVLPRPVAHGGRPGDDECADLHRESRCRWH